MKILGVFLNNEIRTGGHIRCLELMDGLAARGHSVVVLLNSELQYAPAYFVDERLTVRYRRKQFVPISFAFKQAVKRWATERGSTERPEIVIVFGETHLRAATYLKRVLGVPVLFGLQSNSVREALIAINSRRRDPLYVFSRLMRIFLYRSHERRISRWSDGIVFQSSSDRDDFLGRNWRDDRSSFVIGGNIGPPRFTSETEATNESTSLAKILFMGTLGERKGLVYLFEAFERLIAEGRVGLELHIAGPGTEREKESFTQRALRAGISDQVTFYGRVPTTFPLMQECDIMVVPSIFDSYPDVILLALHVGIPVIGSRVGGIPDMLDNHELLFPPADSEAIAQILRKCVDEPVFYGKLRKLASNRRDAFHFDWFERWEDVAKRVIAS